MTTTKLSNYYGTHLKNAFTETYDAFYNERIGYQIGLTKSGESCPFFGDYVTTPDTFTVEKYNGQKYGKSTTDTSLVVGHEFTTPLSTFSIEGTFILPDINPDALEIQFIDSNNKWWGFSVSNEGYILPVFNSNYQGSVVTIASNTPVKFKIEWTQDQAIGLVIYINDVLKSEWPTKDYTIVKTRFKFVQNVYINKLMFSWDNDNYIDFDTYLYNMSYQTGATGSTLVPYQIGYRFTNEGISTSMCGTSMLSERTVGLELNWHTNYEFLDLDLYKCNQLIKYLETEFAKMTQLSAVSIQIVDQEIIEVTTEETTVTIKTSYQITLMEQYNTLDGVGVE